MKDYVIFFFCLMPFLCNASLQKSTGKFIKLQDLREEISNSLNQVYKHDKTLQKYVYPALDAINKMYTTSKTAFERKLFYKNLALEKERMLKQLKNDKLQTDHTQVLLRTNLDDVRKKYDDARKQILTLEKKNDVLRARYTNLKEKQKEYAQRLKQLEISFNAGGQDLVETGTQG